MIVATISFAMETQHSQRHGIILPKISTCPMNCSGNGECLSGTCLCQVRYTGWSCSDSNVSYFASFGTFFYLICMVAIVQLIWRICSDHYKSTRRTCAIDIQKLIYLFVICATGTRAAYFTLGNHYFLSDVMAKNLFFVYYPFILSGFSLIICFWAESFHLSGLQLDKPRFLTKSFCGFIVFNVIVYIVLISQVLTNTILRFSTARKTNEILNGCFAFLMFFVFVFFLIYGVEIFCKVRGAFKQNEESARKYMNFDQLFQSRIGLVAEAIFLLALVMFLISEVLGEFWKEKMSILDRNMVEIAFHVAEVGCALWFPCCFWNVTEPSKLWILNPQNLFKFVADKETTAIITESSSTNYNGNSTSNDADLIRSCSSNEKICIMSNLPSNYKTFDGVGEEQSIMKSEESDCWICYNADITEKKIQPCNCKGDMKLVHHDCLKRWLIEGAVSGKTNRNHTCSVCKMKYKVRRDKCIFWAPNKMQFKAWALTFFIIVTMISIPVIFFFIWHRIHQTVIKAGIVLFLFFAEYCLLRLLGFNFLKAYNITKARALKIIG